MDRARTVSLVAATLLTLACGAGQPEAPPPAPAGDERVKTLAEKSPTILFKACGNTQENMGKAEDKKIPLVEQATVVKSGVVRLMELQEQGWTYLRP